MTNVYAYATFDADGDLIIYSGFERIAPEGDSHVDIEFFQDPVALDEASRATTLARTRRRVTSPASARR